MTWDLPFKPASVVDPERRYFERCGEREKPTRPPSSSASKLARLRAADEAARSFTTSDSPVTACPLARRHTIEARLVDPDGRPLADVRVELRRSDDEALTAKTDADGLVRFQKLTPGAYRLGLPEMDKDVWEILDGEALPEGQDACQGDAEWAAPATTAQEEPARHTAVDGECISTLAFRHGHIAETLWNWPANAELKARRKNRNILHEGDVVVIPPRRPELRAVEHARRYRVRRKASAEEVRVRFLDREGKPRAGEAYLLCVLGPDGEEDRTGTTDGGGFVIETVPSSTTEVRVVLGKDDARETFVFGVASLDPIDTLTGVQERLTNLGYPCVKDAGKLGAFTKRALRDFQRDNGMRVDGELDDATRAAIERAYLS